MTRFQIRKAILLKTFELYSKGINAFQPFIYSGLNKYLKKHNIKLSDIESIELVEATIRERKKGEHNKRQVIKMLLNGNEIEFEIVYYDETFAKM